MLIRISSAVIHSNYLLVSFFSYSSLFKGVLFLYALRCLSRCPDLMETGARTQVKHTGTSPSNGSRVLRTAIAGRYVQVGL